MASKQIKEWGQRRSAAAVVTTQFLGALGGMMSEDAKRKVAMEQEYGRARLWATTTKVSLVNVFKYVLIMVRVLIEGILSLFRSDVVYDRLDVLLKTSGARFRVRNSLVAYGLVIRVGRMMSSLIDLVMDEVAEEHVGVFDVLHARALGDDPLERLHSVQTKFIADFVVPRLQAFDMAVVRVAVGTLALWCAAVCATAFFAPLNFLLSSLVDHTASYGPDDGTSVYHILQYAVICTHGCVLFTVLGSFAAIQRLLQMCSDIMIDIEPGQAEGIIAKYQHEHPECWPLPKGTIDPRLAQELSFITLRRKNVSWMTNVEPGDMKEWWGALAKDIQHCSADMTAQKALYLHIINLGFSMLASYLLVAFGAKSPTLQTAFVVVALAASVLFAYIFGIASSTSRAYGLAVFTESSLHIDSALHIESAYDHLSTKSGGCLRRAAACVFRCCVRSAGTPTTIIQHLSISGHHSADGCPLCKQEASDKVQSVVVVDVTQA